MEKVKLLVATTNEGKLKEIVRILAPLGFEVIKPPHKLEVEETGETFLENAYLKAKAYYEEFGLPSLADDSGLVIEALGGYPGVYSSRFYSLEIGGRETPEPTESEANIRKVLRLMEGKENRRAKFVAFVVLYWKGKGLLAQGECEGEILKERRGDKGFGYDPIFKPAGMDRSMAELEPEEKDKLSHRGKALRRLASLIEPLSSRLP